MGQCFGARPRLRSATKARSPRLMRSPISQETEVSDRCQCQSRRHFQPLRACNQGVPDARPITAQILGADVEPSSTQPPPLRVLRIVVCTTVDGASTTRLPRLALDHIMRQEPCIYTCRASINQGSHVLPKQP